MGLVLIGLCGAFLLLAMLFVTSLGEDGIGFAIIFIVAGVVLGIAGEQVRERDTQRGHALTQLRHDGWKLENGAINKDLSKVRVAPCVTMDLQKFHSHYYVTTKRTTIGGGYYVILPQTQPSLIAACNGKVTK